MSIHAVSPAELSGQLRFLGLTIQPNTHGFAILDQLRSHFPHAQSFLMDRDTLLAHQAQWTDEPQPTQRDLPRLSGDERRLFDDLRWRRLRDESLRLEQERIAFGRVQQAVAPL